MIRNLYKKEINDILQQFWQTKLKSSEVWLSRVIGYITRHLWNNTELTSNIWNGRWTRHMWYDILGINAGDQICHYDFVSFRLWIKRLTSKFFEAQSALSRHRFRLVQRIGDPMYERSPGIPDLVKKRLLELSRNDIENRQCGTADIGQPCTKANKRVLIKDSASNVRGMLHWHSCPVIKPNGIKRCIHGTEHRTSSAGLSMSFNKKRSIEDDTSISGSNLGHHSKKTKLCLPSHQLKIKMGKHYNHVLRSFKVTNWTKISNRKKNLDRHSITAVKNILEHPSNKRKLPPQTYTPTKRFRLTKRHIIFLDNQNIARERIILPCKRGFGDVVDCSEYSTINTDTYPKN
jgi:hypothetical protein